MNRHFIIGFLLISSFSRNIQSENLDGRHVESIVGGGTAFKGQFPWQVSNSLYN